MIKKSREVSKDSKTEVSRKFKYQCNEIKLKFRKNYRERL